METFLRQHLAQLRSGVVTNLLRVAGDGNGSGDHLRHHQDVAHRIVYYLERGLTIAVALTLCNIVAQEGLTGLAKYITLFVRKLPFVDSLLNKILDGEVNGAVKLLANAGSADSQQLAQQIEIPKQGLSAEQVIQLLKELKDSETAAEDGKAFAYTYTTSTDMSALSEALRTAYATFSEKSELDDSQQHKELLDKVWELFMHTNALNPMMYPSLRKFENEVVSMTAWMVHGDTQVAGSVTSGGTESVLMAVKTYRDRARKLRPHITKPNMIVADTIHPAFEKASHYFDVEIIHVKMTSDYRMDVEATRRAINGNTILIVGSACQYCHGVVDPIVQLSELALSKGLPLHVDACFGGFMLPWVEKLGHKVPLWDFRVPGVTSISADVHKYGYSSKGASIILYRNAELRSYQYFSYALWPGGLFGSPSMAGSRPGGMLAAAWTAMVTMGQDGYLKQAEGILNTTQKLVRGITESIPELKILTVPDMTAVSIVSSNSFKVNILAVAECMERIGGWKMERQQLPDSLHFSVLPQHARVIDKFLNDLRQAVAEVVADPSLASQGSAGVYGMVSAIPDKSIVDSFIIKLFSKLYTLEPGPGLVDSFLAKSRK
jgi:sphinganine-1-phosphate aldolase